MISPIRSNLFNLGVQIPSFEFVAILPFSNGEVFNNINLNALKHYNILLTDNLIYQVTQPSASKIISAGEPGGNSSYLIKNKKFNINLKIPILSPYVGWVDPAFAFLWKSLKYGILGSSLSLITELNSGQTITTGTTSIIIKNIEDFLDLTLPATAILTDGTLSETITITAANYTNRTITINPLVTSGWSINNLFIYKNTTIENGFIEPSLSLICTEGILWPSIVSKITLTIPASGYIEADIEVVPLFINRSYQKTFLNYQQIIHSLKDKISNYRRFPGAFTKIYSISSNYGNFGITQDTDLINGLQTLILDNGMYESITITINNQIEVVNANRKWNNESKYLNLASYSKGRLITGEIKLKKHINPILIQEKIASVSNLNYGGIKIDMGCFALEFEEVAWTPTSSQKYDDRNLNFDVISDSMFYLPELLYSEVYGR